MDTDKEILENPSEMEFDSTLTVAPPKIIKNKVDSCRKTHGGNPPPPIRRNTGGDDRPDDDDGNNWAVWAIVVIGIVYWCYTVSKTYGYSFIVLLFGWAVFAVIAYIIKTNLRLYGK